MLLWRWRYRRQRVFWLQQWTFMLHVSSWRVPYTLIAVSTQQTGDKRPMLCQRRRYIGQSLNRHWVNGYYLKIYTGYSVLFHWLIRRSTIKSDPGGFDVILDLMITIIHISLISVGCDRYISFSYQLKSKLCDHIQSVLRDQCWANVVDGGQHWSNIGMYNLWCPSIL